MNAYTWYVPDTLTITTPSQQGPTVVPSEDGLTNVVIGTHWALKGVADDGTEIVMCTYTPFKGNPDPANFVPFDQITPQHLETWLFSAPDGVGMLSKADQQSQMDDRIRARQRSLQDAGPVPLNPSAGQE